MNCSRTRKLITGITAAALLFAAGAPRVMAEESPAADASVGFYSKYVWRGYELSDDSMVIQPSLSVSYKGFGANLWANLDTDNAAYDSNKWNETDLTLSYDGAYEKLGYGVGWIYYALDGVDDTQEFYASISYDTILSPSLTIYYDFDAFDGDWYANLSIGHSFAIAEKYSLDLGMALGYYSIDGGDPSEDGSDYSALHDGVLSASMSFPVGKYVTITPELYWSFPLSDDAEDFYNYWSFSGDDDSYVYGGVSASFSF